MTQWGYFEGTVQAEWFDPRREMKLLCDFTYVDPAGYRWLAPQAAVVDGASIPRMLWTAVGSPFTGEYRNASVVHDVACDERLQPWQAVHRMFYFACRCGGVGQVRAKVMFAAVYHFGPRWGEDMVYALPATIDNLARLSAFVEREDPPLEAIESYHL